MPKPLTVWITTNCGTFLKRCEHQTTLSASWETCIQDKKQQWELNIEQWTSLKLGKEYIKAVYFHLAYLTTCRVRHVKCWVGWITSRNPDCQEKYQPQIFRWYHFNSRKWRETEEPLDESERGDWKIWLKPQHSKKKIMASGPITSWQIDGKNVESVRFLLLGLQNRFGRWLQPWN